MEKIKFHKDDSGEYSTSRGRWCKYFFNQDNQDALIIFGETDDYFYFTLALKDGLLKDKFDITINDGSVMYQHFSKLVAGFKLIDVLEEGSPERKSLAFEKMDNAIKVTFNLTSEQKVFYTIEFANLRRLGDTRFKNLIIDNDDTANIEQERDFRYKFKVRLHNMMNDLESLYNEKQIQQR